MKKNKIIEFFVYLSALILLLCSCSAPATVYTIEKNNVSFEVNTENNTISDGTYIYEYTFSGNSTSYDVEITYPNGAWYWCNMSGYSGSSGWDGEYDTNKYIDGDILCNVLLEKAPKAADTESVLLIVFLFAIGIFSIAAPRAVWYLEYGWRFKEAEPSDLAISFNRIGGIIAIIIAIILIVSK